MRQLLELGLQLVEELLVVAVRPDHQSDGSAFDAHRDAEILSARCEAVLDVLLLAHSWQMTHYVDRVDVPSEDHDALLALADSRLNVLQSIDDVLGSLFRRLLDELVDLLGQLSRRHRLGDPVDIQNLLVYKT